MIKLYFTDFWTAYNQNDNFFVDLLRRYNIDYVISREDPDIIIYSVFGNRHKIYKNAKKVFYTGENYPPRPDADLNLTFDFTNNYNNIRIPHWLFYMGGKFPKKELFNLKLTPKNNPEFCCFIYSNNVNFRNNFCKDLMNYKQIACGGSCLNNIGGKVDNKIKFQKMFKFSIAFENSKGNGYVTEKIFQAYESNTIPIYFGAKGVVEDFNPETFINGNDFNNFDELIKYIIKVDNDDELYNSYMNKPIYSKKWLDIFNDKDEKYFKDIFYKIKNLH
jgi:hypothetical protein